MARLLPDEWFLRLYIAATYAFVPLAPVALRRRLGRGKEDPARWREKLGKAGLVRPDGPAVWLHAVGLGEVLALRGLILAMAKQRPDLHFLVTSSARSSAQVFARNAPPRTQHQFLPLDAMPFVRSFLDHWRPDLSIWAEQDIWPGLVVETHRRGIPLALVNGRMNAGAYASRARVRSVYAALYRRFSMIFAQDQDSARYLEALGAVAPVPVTGSLKASAPVLVDQPEERARTGRAVEGRRLWCAASTHQEDEAVVLAAQARLFAADPRSLLVLAPRDPVRADSIKGAARALGLGVAARSLGEVPGPGDAVYLADSFGEMGLWYRLCPVVFMGGSFGPVSGHNPWEPAHFGAAILHGPNVANFAADYEDFAKAGASHQVNDVQDLIKALGAVDLVGTGLSAQRLAISRLAAADDLAVRLLSLLPDTEAQDA